MKKIRTKKNIRYPDIRSHQKPGYPDVKKHPRNVTNSDHIVCQCRKEKKSTNTTQYNLNDNSKKTTLNHPQR
uniref:Uncharacterized protein n=1 Tax=Romanomermis culicivorax TaxID=13658 RepID=A0A915HW24_ROMCU